METTKNTKETSLSNVQLLFMILLRVFIGWYFFYEGLAKLFNPSWSAQSYLENSHRLFPTFFI